MAQASELAFKVKRYKEILSFLQRPWSLCRRVSRFERADRGADLERKVSKVREEIFSSSLANR